MAAQQRYLGEAGVPQHRLGGPGFDLPGSALEWKKLDTVYYVTPGAILPYPRAVEKACQQLDPGFILMAVRNAYRDEQGNVHLFDRYVTALGDDGNRMSPIHRDFAKYQIRYPLFYHGPRPHEILDIYEGEEIVKGLPGPFQPFDWAEFDSFKFYLFRMQQILEMVQAEKGSKKISPEKLNAMIQEAAFKRTRTKEMRLKAEVDARWDDDWKHIQRLREKVGLSDLKEAGLA